jgi:hypothetical protein
MPYDRTNEALGPAAPKLDTSNAMVRPCGMQATIAAALVALALFAAFRSGIMRDLHSTFADQSWGRVQFAIGAAITSRYHNGYGYTISNVIREVLASAGLTGDPVMLKVAGVTFPDNLRNPSLMESAIRKAISFTWPFNPNERITGSSGEDVGLVDFVRLSFMLFGGKLVGFYLTYFALVGTSFAAAIVAFRRMPGVLVLFILYGIALFVLFRCNLLDFNNVGILDPRFLSTLSLVPATHIALAMLVWLRPSAGQTALVLLQAAILILACWIRSSALWTVLGLLLFATLIAAHAVWQRKPTELARAWPFAILAMLTAGHFVYVTQALHPVYATPNERPHHGLWHAMIYGVAIHPDWRKKYAAQFGLENTDEVPETVAKKYLLRHPPDNPDAVYLTADHEYLRIGAAEIYKRKAFLELLANDPKFVLEAFLIYNPQLCIKAFSLYATSFDRLSAFVWAAIVIASLISISFLILDRRERRRFFSTMVLVTAGFGISMSPMFFTAPGPAVMADQLFMLIAGTIGWVVLMMSNVIESVTRKPHPVRAVLCPENRPAKSDAR